MSSVYIHLVSADCKSLEIIEGQSLHLMGTDAWVLSSPGHISMPSAPDNHAWLISGAAKYSFREDTFYVDYTRIMR